MESIAKEALELENTVFEVCPSPDCALLPSERPLLLDLLGIYTGIDIDSSEMLDSKGRRWLSVELGDLVEDIDSFLLFALGQEKLGRFVKVEDEESDEKDQKSDTSQDTDQNPPAGIGSNSTAGLSDPEVGSTTRLERWIASVFSDSTVGDTGCGDDSDWLPEGQERDEVSTVLR